MQPFQIDITSAERLRANWAFILEENRVPELIALGIVDIVEEAAINARTLARDYSGRVDLRPLYRAYGEIIAEKGPFRTVIISPNTAYAVAGLVAMMEEQIPVMLIEDNDGTMPPILPPIVVEPIPDTPVVAPETPPTTEPNGEGN